jgi:hypothetical protein
LTTAFDDKKDDLYNLKLKLKEQNIESNILTSVLTDKLYFMNRTHALDSLFKSHVINPKDLEESIHNKTEALNSLKQNVEEKSHTLDGLNSTLRKLRSVQEEYRGISC